MESVTNLDRRTLEGLQDLIEINIDSSKGFESAAEKIDNHDIANYFRRVGMRRNEFARELQEVVAVNGEPPEDTGSAKATLHRWWLNLRGTVQPDEEHAVLAEAERGEDAIKSRYEAVLKDTAGSPLTATLHSQYRSVKQDHDTIRDMRDVRA